MPGVPVGGDSGGLGVTLRVVSLGSCARAGAAAASSSSMATQKADEAEPLLRAKTDPIARDKRPRSSVELVVCVSLTRERTVYFTL